MTWWIATFFTTMSVLVGPGIPIGYVGINTVAEQLDRDLNAYDVVDSTMSVGNYVLSISTIAKAPNSERAPKRVYKCLEQTLLVSNGRPSLLVTKFLAKPQWVMLMNDPLFPENNFDVESLSEHFVVSTDSNVVAQYAINKGLITGLKYRIYKGQEYEYTSREDYSFKLKK